MRWWIDKNDIVKAMVKQDSKIVDIGCGPIPIFKNSINVDKEKQNVPNFIHSSAEELPFNNLEFDYAILSELLEHVSSPEVVLAEAQRVAKFIVIVVPNEVQWHDKLKPFSHPDHVRYFTEVSLFKLAVAVGLQEPEFIKICVMGWSHFILFGVSKNIDYKEINNEEIEK